MAADFAYPLYRVFDRPAPLEDAGRPRIIGLETEYLVLYIPADPRDARPLFHVIEETVFDALLAGRKAAASRLSKQGYFLENGGLVHMEIALREQADTPILEMATPECRSAWDAMVYARAFDLILEDISKRSSRALAELGFDGYVSFGKSNRDSRGVGFGSHENYLIYQEPSARDKTIFWLGAPFVAAAWLPAFALVGVLIAVVLIGMLIAWLAPWLARGFERLRQRMRGHPLLRHLTLIAHLGSSVILFPGIALYTWILRACALRPFIADLAPFVASRSALTGSGRLNLEDGCFETSQRAGMVRTLSDIVIFGQKKTMFDLKSLLYRPASMWQPVKKLVITCGDSSLSDVPLALALGTTVILLEMIEAGERFDELRIADPVRALRTWSRAGPRARQSLLSGEIVDALELQRRFLQRAQRFVDESPERRARHGEMLALWEHVLDAVGDERDDAARCVEWIAKRRLIDEVLASLGDRDELFAWGRIFALVDIDALARAHSLDETFAQLGPGRRRRAQRSAAGLDPQRFCEWRDVWLRARKIDLRFHELSALGGYQRTLEKGGLIVRLSDDADVAKASRTPPPDTRARVRGHFIRSATSPDAVAATWNWVETPSRHVSLADPFDHEIPGR